MDDKDREYILSVEELELDENFNPKLPLQKQDHLTWRHNAVKFTGLTLTIFALFIFNAFVQEKLFLVPGFKTFGWFLTLIQASVYILLSSLQIRFRRQPIKTQVPTSIFALVGFVAIATTGLSNASVGYMNYPTQLMFKSCKIIPVMIGGIFIQGKRYGSLDFGAAASMTVGLIFFSLADVEVAPNFQMKGIIMVCLSLCADAVIGNMQEKLLVRYQISNAHLILWSYSIGWLYILGWIIVTGELFSAVTFCSEHPSETLPLMLTFGFTGYFGVNAILLFIQYFGAVLAVTVTTLRKSLTVCLSFILFEKPFTMQYLWSGLLVIFGIYLSGYSKNRASVNAVVYRCFNYFIGNRLKKLQPVIRVNLI